MGGPGTMRTIRRRTRELPASSWPPFAVAADRPQQGVGWGGWGVAGLQAGRVEFVAGEAGQSCEQACAARRLACDSRSGFGPDPSYLCRGTETGVGPGRARGGGTAGRAPAPAEPAGRLSAFGP